MVNLDRRSSVPRSLISMLSMTIEPLEASTNLKKDNASVDLPLPVLPTTPIFSCGLTENVRPFNTGSRSAAYLISRSLTSILPRVGH
jgi:hypothetical protein